MSGYISFNPWFPSMLRQQVDQPATSRGRLNSGWMSASERQLLPTDALSNFALTLTNVVVGSIWSAEIVTTGEQVATGAAAAETVSVNIPVYVQGSTKNDIRIKVRKATSAPFYQPLETQITIVKNGALSLRINQVSDEN